MIYSVPVPYTNTIYSRYVYKNAGGDLQIILSGIERYKDQIDVTRCLFAKYEEITKYTDIDKLTLEMNVSNGDLNTSGEIGITLHAITKYWTPGIVKEGYFLNTVIQEGSTWKYSDTNITWDNLGGDFIELPIGSYTLSYRNIYLTIKFDITDNHDNEGFILKLNNLTASIGIINIYSANTHTTFYPKFVAYINDYVYTASLNTNLIILSGAEDRYIYSLDNLENTYSTDDIVKFIVNITPKTYSRDWTELYHYYNTNSFTLTNSIVASYAIYDVSQLEKLKVISHSDYTRISCDGTSNYFNFDMSSLLVNKYYQILLKIGNRIYLDLGIFKIV